MVQAVDYRDGAEPNVVRRVPGAVSYEAITLERDLTRDTAFEDWADQVRQAGASQPAGYLKSVRIEVLDPSGRPLVAYDLYRCWPSSYRPLPEMAGGAPPRLVESITLMYDGWERDRSVIWPA
jgi:phage tail-like protein